MLVSTSAPDDEATLTVSLDGDASPVDLPVSTPTSATARNSSSVGTCGCSYIDPLTRANLGESLLLAACHAAVLDTHAKPFANAEGAVPGTFEELRAFVVQAPAGERGSLSALSQRLNAFVESKRTWLARAPLASEASLLDKALGMRAVLHNTAAKEALHNAADRLAGDAIVLYDHRGVSHCTQRCADTDALAAHRASCPFRPQPCTNSGCMDVLSAAGLAAHDTSCVYKHVLCVQGCGAEVRRKDMAQHAATVCPCKPVACPFKHLGCLEPVTQGSRDAHVEGGTPGHTLLLLDATTALRREADASARAVTEVQRRIAADAVAATGAAAALAERVDRAEREARDAKKEGQQAKDEARRAKEEAKQARDMLSKLERQVKELATAQQLLTAAATTKK